MQPSQKCIQSAFNSDTPYCDTPSYTPRFGFYYENGLENKHEHKFNLTCYRYHFKFHISTLQYINNLVISYNIHTARITCPKMV